MCRRTEWHKGGIKDASFSTTSCLWVCRDFMIGAYVSIEEIWADKTWKTYCPLYGQSRLPFGHQHATTISIHWLISGTGYTQQAKIQTRSKRQIFSPRGIIYCQNILREDKRSLLRRRAPVFPAPCPEFQPEFMPSPVFSYRWAL